MRIRGRRKIENEKDKKGREREKEKREITPVKVLLSQQYLH